MEVSLRVFSGNIYHLDVPDFIDVASGCPSALSLSLVIVVKSRYLLPAFAREYDL